MPSVRTEIKLAEETFLTDDFLRQLINVGEVDILVGLPTHNNAKTIGAVVQSIQTGILRLVSPGPGRHHQSRWRISGWNSRTGYGHFH